MSSNLPPGCRESDIPGNRPEDIAYDKFLNTRLQIMWEDWIHKMYEDPGTEFDKNQKFSDHVDKLFEDWDGDQGCNNER